MADKKTSFQADAIRLFVQFSGWVAGPVIVAVIAGKWLDARYGTKPWIFLGLIAFAFIITSIALTRQALDAMKAIETKESPKDQTKQ